MRISLINADGTVLYDGNVNIGGLDNHGNRPEVQQALTEGVGQSVRRSDTMGQSAFYYALRLDDGMVLRVAKETSSIWRLFASCNGSSDTDLYILLRTVFQSNKKSDEAD